MTPTQLQSDCVLLPHASEQAISPARHAAYRRLALAIVAADAPTLTVRLRFRRQLRAVERLAA